MDQQKSNDTIVSGSGPNIQLQTSNPTPVLEFRVNGDILVRGKFIENDKEVVDGIRGFLKDSERYKKPIESQDELWNEVLQIAGPYDGREEAYQKTMSKFKSKFTITRNQK